MLDCDAAAHGKPFWSMEEAIPSPDHTLLAYTFDPTGSERCSIRIRDLATGRNLPDRISGARERSRLERRQRYAVLRPPRPAAAADAALAACARHARRARTCWCSRRRTPRSRSASASRNRAATSCSRPMPTTTARSGSSTPSIPPSRRAASRRARPAISTASTTTPSTADRRPAGHRHQLRRRGRLPPMHGAGRRSRIEALAARSCRTRPGCRIVDLVAYAAPSRAARARGWPAAHRRPPLERRRGARDRIRRGGLRPLPRGRPRLRHRYDALRLFLDDDAGGDLRLRHGDAHPRRCASAGTSRAATIPADYVTRRLHARAADGEEIPISLLSSRDDAARRHRAAVPDTPTAPTATPWTPSSSQLRLVAGRSRLRLRHRPRARRRGQGPALVRRAARHRHKRNTFTDFIACGRASDRRQATRGAGGSSPTANRPAAC